MRRQQGIHAIVLQLAAQWFELDFLQNYIPVGVSYDFFGDPIPLFQRCIHHTIGRNSGCHLRDRRFGMAFFFGKEVLAVCNQKLLIARAGVVHPRKVDLIENAVAKCEPNLTMQVKGCADARFRAGSPTRLNTRPSWSGQILFVSQWTWP